MSTQKTSIPPKRGRGRPSKVNEDMMMESEDKNKPVNPKFAIPSEIEMDEDENLEKIIQQIHDSEIATAMNESFAIYKSNTHFNINGGISRDPSIIDNSMDDDMEFILQQIRDQEEQELSSKYIRELQESESNVMASGMNDNETPISIARVLEEQDAEVAEIRKNVSKKLKYQELRYERERQDREYAECLQKDQEKEKIKQELQKQNELKQIAKECKEGEQSQSKVSSNIKVDNFEIPKTKEELRLARMQFFSKILK